MMECTDLLEMVSEDGVEATCERLGVKRAALYRMIRDARAMINGTYEKQKSRPRIPLMHSKRVCQHCLQPIVIRTTMASKV